MLILVRMVDDTTTPEQITILFRLRTIEKHAKFIKEFQTVEKAAGILGSLVKTKGTITSKRIEEHIRENCLFIHPPFVLFETPYSTFLEPGENYTPHYFYYRPRTDT